MPDVSDSPIVIYAAIGVVLLLAAGTVSEKALGPIGRWWYDFAERRRQAATRRDDADIADLKRQIRILTSANESRDERLANMERFVEDVARWGFDVRQLTAAAGIEVPPFPTLHRS